MAKSWRATIISLDVHEYSSRATDVPSTPSSYKALVVSQLSQHPVKLDCADAATETGHEPKPCQSGEPDWTFFDKCQWPVVYFGTLYGAHSMCVVPTKLSMVTTSGDH